MANHPLVGHRLFYTAAFIIGILSPKLSGSWLVATLLMIILTAIWNAELRSSSTLLLALLAYLIGGGRAVIDEKLAPTLQPTSKITIRGTIIEPPRAWGNSAAFFFQVDSADKPYKVLVSWSGCQQTIEVGDQWELTGRLVEGESAAHPGGFDQRQWLWSQRALGVLKLNRYSPARFVSPPRGTSPYQLGYRARSYMLGQLQGISDPDARSLIAGVVFGESGSLPASIREDFRRTGTAHLLAASGLNVALLVGLVMAIAKLFGYGPSRVAPAAIPVVICYAFLAGCGPSITRAATSATLALVALFWGRKTSPWNTLIIAVWLLCLWDPRQVYDLGFQLSAIAVIGIVAGPKSPTFLPMVSQSLVTTISASLTTLPIFWWAFGEFSSTLLISNVLITPFIQLLLPLGLAVTVITVSPLLKGCELLAQLSLILIDALSNLRDPIVLTQMGLLECLPLALAWVCWLRGRRWSMRLLCIPLVALSLWLNLERGQLPLSEPDQMIVRRVGVRKPIYWISTPNQEVLVISHEWQEKRGRSMVRQMGCLKSVELRILEEHPLSFSWGEFRWSSISSLLPDARYLEVIIKDGHYRVVIPPGFEDDR